jgi:phosphotransferase system HPr (HPr) family protein
VALERTVTIVNTEGLHARPSGVFVSVANEFESELRIRCGERDVNGRSILELITLGAGCGAELHLSAEGPDAEALVAALVRLVEAGFEVSGS